MSKRDNFSNHDFFQCIPPVNMLGSGDLTGACIDTQGFEALTIGVNVGRLSAITSVSYIQLILEHTDASALGAGPSDYAIVSATDVIGPDAESLTSGIWKKLFTSGAAALSTLGSQVYKVGYRGNKQYVRCVIDLVDSVGAASDAIGAFAIQSLEANWPINAVYDVSTSDG